MNKSIPDGFLIVVIFLFLVSSCAKVGTPSGGRRDRIPPEVVSSSPENRAVNFRGNRIEIEFNEYVVLDNVNEKLMVSPPLAARPRISIKKKSVVAQFDEELRDSSTYTFYFQDAIKDLNEGNFLENFQFVFSTGPVVDSLSVTGSVFNSLNLEVPEKTIVLMYSDLSDSAVMKQLPDYISMVEKDGNFRIENVREGIYRLYALKDANNSKNYDIGDEEFAFIDSAITVNAENNYRPVIEDTSSIKIENGKSPLQAEPGKTVKEEPDQTVSAADTGQYKLILFAPLRKARYLTSSSRPSKYQLVYTLSLPPDSLDFDFSIPEWEQDAYFLEKSLEKDTIKVWLTDSILYSQELITTIVTYPFTDSVGDPGYLQDTLLMRFIEPRETRATKVKKPPFNVIYNISKGSLKPGQEISITAETPFRQPDTTQIRLYELSDTISINLDYALIEDSTNSGRYILEAGIEPGNQYLYIADSAAFGNIYNESSDSTGIKFTVRDAESYSKLTLNIQNYNENLIIQLMNNTEKLLYEKFYSGSGQIVFPLLDPGFYRIRAIFDLNGDGKWTTGDFELKRQPEPVSYYPAEIEIKTGWEAEQDWDLDKLNYKEPKLRSIPKGR